MARRSEPRRSEPRSVEEIRSRLAELDEEATGRPMSPSEADEWNRLGSLFDEFTKREQALRDVFEGRGNGDLELESGSGIRNRTRTAASLAQGPGDEHRAAALRAVDRLAKDNILTPEAADRQDEFVRRPDPTGCDARYLAAVSDEHYDSAFGKATLDPVSAVLRFTSEEQRAWAEVQAAEELRGLVGGTGSAGGFALPTSLDPSIRLSSSGVLNPIRSVATVIQIQTRDWKGVSSAGVTASYDPEASEVSDDTPTLAQPTITTAMGRAFVPFSIEVGQDWATISQELAKLISDGKDVLESDKFLSGSGSGEPGGVLTGATTLVTGAGTAALGVADVYSLRTALPARFQAGATFAASPTLWDSVYRLVAAGSTTEPPLLVERGGPLLGTPKIEWSSMTATLATGQKTIVYGDLGTFVIAERQGLTAELVPHLAGASGRPTGQRGMFAWWRNGSVVTVPSALRVLIQR